MESKEERGNPIRSDIGAMIENGDLKGLLKKSGEIHGHLCNYLAYGVKAGYNAVKELGVKNTGMEEIVAIVETNNCFSDGVQVVTGCTFGNNALIYKDLGKTAVTVAKRNGEAIRIVMKPDFVDSREEEYPEAYALWDEIVAERKDVEPEKRERMMKLFHEMSLKEIEKPIDEMFDIEREEIDLPDHAPIFDSVRCSSCGENVMGSKAKKKGEEMYCLQCLDEKINVLNGGGIFKR